ncbi:MAG TPA: PAS domain S-box protein, partial [Anaerolineales bacterium]|nr:PAS domain S-box protein [Anaerolineales bacterium]
GFGNEATVALPLIVGDRVLGGLAFSFVEKREFLLEERGFLLAVAQQCAQGLERANTTEALRESEERHRALINQTTAGIIRKDANGKILFVNGAFCQMLGCSESDLVGKTMWQITHELDVVENRRLYNRLIAEGTPFELEKRLLRKDGSILWATVSVSPVLDTDGKPKSAVSVYTDITERKQTETALNESRERFRNLFNLVPVAVYTCDAEGLIQEFNRSAVELWGREPYTNDPSERYCGSFKIFYPDGRFMPHKNCPMARMLNGETLDPSELEIVVERPDGSRRNVIAHPLPLKDESGRIVGAINCLYDMTERRQAERGLSLLVEVSDLTRRFEDSSELMSAVAETVGRYFHVRRSLFNEIDIEKNLEIVHNDYHDGIESVEGVHKLTDYSEVTSAEIMAGKTIVNTDSKTDPRTAQDYERSYLPTGERAYVAVPLMRGERWVASLWISDDAPRQWSREDVSLLETVAERTWTASEKLRIHAALRDSEERLRVTFNTTAVGFATLTPDTYFVDINEAFCSIVGYSREELLGMNFSSLTHPDYLKSTQDHIAALLNGEVPSFTIEKLYIRRDGREVWLQNSVSLVRDADGNPLHLIAIIQDVTERRETEDALYQLNLELEARVLNRTAELQSAYEFLRESEATSRLILESMPDAIVITDQDGKIVHANTQVESLFGYSPSEVLGQEVEILLPERYHRQHIKNREFYANQRGRRIMGLGLDLYGRRKDESEFPVDVMLSPINNNTTWDVMVSIRDNTKQRQAQEALRINEEKLRTLFEILPVGISFLDKEGRISDLNPALTEIVGLPKNELMRGIHQPLQFIRTDGSLMPPGELASTRARLEQKTIYNVETGIARANGEIRWTSVSAAPVQVADVEAAVVTVDITERKQAEETLHNHRERLKVLSRRLVEVQEEERRAIARELHDRVGQNLAALTLNLNILRNQLSSEALQKIGTRLNDSVSLVNDILGITRNVMADLRPNVLDDYGLDAALNEYADRYTQRFGIQVSTNFPDHPTPRLDPGIEMTLLRIAQEALTNIARHSKANKATVSLEMENDAVLLKVEDNGTGILSWQKVNQPGSHGLKIMRERAEAFGGSLKVNSAYKSGTIIEARIPLGSSTRNKVSQEKRS